MRVCVRVGCDGGGGMCVGRGGGGEGRRVRVRGMLQQ